MAGTLVVAATLVAKFRLHFVTILGYAQPIQHISEVLLMRMFRLALLLTACLSPLAAVAQDNVVINEFLASNNSTTGLRDENNELNDWIEIYNAGTNVVNLENWGLTDSAGNPFQWRFPTTNLNVGAYLVIFASEKDRRIPGARLHTNFRLSASGEYLALVRPDGSIASEFSPTYISQVPNVSYGRGVLSTNHIAIASNAPVRVLVPNAGTPATWNMPSFDDSSWIAGTNGVGFGPASTPEPDYPATVIPTAPVGYWRLNESAGAIAGNTGSGANLDGTYTSATVGTAGPRTPQFGGFEVNNNAPTFNGTSGYVAVPNSLLNNRGAFTVAGWIKPAITPGARIGLFGQNDAVEFGFISGTTMQCWTPGGGSVNATYTHPMNTWHHVAAVGNGANIRIFVDGVQIASGGTATSSYGTSSEQFRIGGGGIFDMQSVNGNYFNGQVDEVLAYHRALSDAEIMSLYQGGLSPVDLNINRFVNTDIGPAMSNINASAYIRLPFFIENPTNVTLLTLRARYDDGFVAFINGTQLMRANAPSTLAFNSAATNTHSPAGVEEFRLGAANLVAGINILAIHGLNRTSDDSDFLVAAELETTSLAGESPNPVFFTTPSPGADNRGGVAIPGPAILEPQHAPNVPLDTQDLLITTRLAPTFYPIASVVLRYRVMFGAEIELQMFDDGVHGDGAAGDLIYGATIPNSAYTNGQMVRWFIRATDTQSGVSRWPLFTLPNGSAEYLGTMVEVPGLTSKLPIIHLFAPPTILQPGPDATPQIGADSHAGARVSLFHDGEFYDNIHMELRGNSTSGFRKKSHRVNFNREHLFRHPGPGPRIRETSFVADYPDPTYMRQGLSFWLADQMGAPAPFYEPVRLQLNGQFYQLANHSDIHDVELLDRLGYDPRGALYNAAGTVVPGQFSTGGFEKKTRNHENNSDYAALANAIAETVAADQRRINVFENFDLPEVINYLTVARWVHENDDVWANMSLYHDNDGDNLWRIIPFDLNLSWGAIFYEGGTPSVIEGVQATNDIHKAHPLYGSSQATALSGPGAPNNYNRVYDAFFLGAQTREMFLRRMRTLLDTYIGPPGTPPGTSPAEQRILQLRDLIAEEANRDRAWWQWPGKGGQSNFDPGISFTNGVNAMLSDFVAARRHHFYNRHSVVNTNFPIGVSKAQNAGIPLDQPADAVVQIHSFEVNPSSGNQDQEFICITNPLPYAVDMSDWELSGGVKFKFAKGTVMTTNSVLYVSPNVVAFRARAASPRGGQGHFVVGKYDGQLSARGEAVMLHDQWGRAVHTNSYPGNPSDAQRYLRITELMYSPAGAQSYEYIELKNIGPTPLDLRGVRLADGVLFSFTGSAVTNLGAGQSVLVVADTNAFAARYGTGFSIAGRFTGSLENGGERVRLVDSSNEEILDFTYNNSWYPITDGLGFSLVIVDENAEPDTWSSKAAWRPSGALNGSPGISDPPAPALAPIRINELLTHTDPPVVDAVELFNPTASDVNIGGWFLTDDRLTPKKFRIPDGTMIGAGSYAVFTEADFNPTPGMGTSFSFSSRGDEAFLLSGDAASNLTGYLHGYDFGPAENGVSFGPHVISTGDEHFVARLSVTLGTANSGPRSGPVSITEIMYRPTDIAGADNDLDEYIELQNRLGSPTPLFDPAFPTNTWRLEKGVEFAFPTNVTMAASSRLLVVNFNPTNTTRLNEFRARFGISATVPIFGPYGGKLDNSGERIELRKPNAPEVDGSVDYVLVERVDYKDSAPWPAAADGGGASLQRNPLVGAGPASIYPNDPANWVAVVPTPGSANSSSGTPPQITTQPQSQRVIATTDATLSVLASGSAPLFYQWRHRGSNIDGATNAMLALDNVQASDRGEYNVLVFNARGSTVSSNAVITVLVPARILQQPGSITYNRGSTNSATWGQTFSNFTFSVVASSSSPITYQWLFNGVEIPGATSDRHVVTNATIADNGAYQVIITDAVGPLPSATATLTINIPVIVYQHPSTVIAVAGDTVNFIVNAGGTQPITYTWRRNGTIMNPQPGTPFLTLTNVQPGPTNNYRAVVTNPGFVAPGVLTTIAFLIVLADTDGDRMPDSYETNNGFIHIDPADGSADADGDLVSNRDEYTAGTDPRDRDSFLKVNITAGAGANLTFLAQSNKTYSIQFRDDLTGAMWQRLTNVTSRLTNYTHEIPDPSATTNRFYRVVTPYQP